MIFVLARTDADVAKHAGISFLLMSMDQPGVECRPITNIVRHDHFNEVFFTDARCPKENVLGGVNNGWAVGNTLLGFERGVGATVGPLGFRAELDEFIELAKEPANSTIRWSARLARFHTAGSRSCATEACKR